MPRHRTLIVRCFSGEHVHMLLAEALCLGVVACQFPGKRLKWNSKEMRVTNRDEANLFLEGKYRKF